MNASSTPRSTPAHPVTAIGLRPVTPQPAGGRRALQRLRVQVSPVAGLCHELRNPLGAMLLFTQMMACERDGALSPAQAERLEGLAQAARQALEMLDDVRRQERLAGLGLAGTGLS